MLFALPDGVLGVTGASEPWELELVRWSGLTLVLLALAVGAARRRGIAVLRTRGAIVRQVVVVMFASAYLVSARSFYLIVGFSALVHLTLHVAAPVMEEVYARAKVRAGY